MNHTNNIYKLVAFIDAKGILYIFKWLHDFILVSIYGHNAKDETAIRYLGGSSEALDTLVSGTGIAFYLHRPFSFKRTKGIVLDI